MTYLHTPIVAFSAAIFSVACSAGSESGDEQGATSNENDPSGDGDGLVQLGDGDATAGDGDAQGPDAGDGDGDAMTGDGDGDGDGDGINLGAGAAGSGGSPAAGAGGGPSVQTCTPNLSGTFVVDTDVVLDERTCLTWMRAHTTGDPYAAAVAYCDALVLGGYDDWRIPTAGEAVSLFKCDGMWPPIDDTVFNVSGDGIWTSTESGTIAGNDPKVCGAGQSSGSFYDFGPVEGQNTRCVRGAVTLPDRTDCKTNTQICQ